MSEPEQLDNAGAVYGASKSTRLGAKKRGSIWSQHFPKGIRAGFFDPHARALEDKTLAGWTNRHVQPIL